METFIIILASDKRSHRVDAASWECSNDFHLTNFDQAGQKIDTWSPNEWYRLIEQNQDGAPVDKFVNPHLSNPMYS